MRSVPLVLLLALAVSLAACGGDKTPASPGSKANPLVAHESPEKTTNEGQRKVAGSPSAKTKAPGYSELLKRQSSKPRGRFTPCSLVTRQQAGAIVGAPVLEPVEAPQGPTCIYRTTKGDQFVTLAVQPLAFARASRQMKGRQRLDIGGRPAYCGRRGASVLYASLSKGRVLSVTAPCAIAKRFAARAIAR